MSLHKVSVWLHTTGADPRFSEGFSESVVDLEGWG